MRSNTSQFISMLQNQLDEKTKKLTQIGEKRSAILEEEACLVKEVDAIKILLSAEKRELGLNETEHVLEPQTEKSTDGPEVNVAQVVRDLIKMNASNGTSMTEVKLHLKSAGITVHENYPYSLMKRLVKTNQVQKARGKYFPV